MEYSVGDGFWQNAVAKYPLLKGVDELRNNSEYFVAVVKSLHEIDVAEAEGNKNLSKYKDPKKITKLVDEMKSFEGFFCEVAEKNEQDLFLNEGILNDFSACNTFISNDNMVACSSLNELISNRSGLPEVVQIREKMITGLSYHLPRYIDCELNSKENASAIQGIIEDDPKGILALMAVSAKNSQLGVSKVKIFSPEDLEVKKNVKSVQEFAENLPLTQCYAYALNYATEKANPIPGMDKNRVLGCETSELSSYGLKRQARI